MNEPMDMAGSAAAAGRQPPPDEAETIGAGFAAILGELVQLLERFSETGERGVIDLHTLPMSPVEYENLRDVLGRGEVAAELDIGGPSSIYETSFHGAWWVQHCTPDGEVAAEYIEVAAVPEMLLADASEARRDAQRLRTRIAHWEPLASNEGVTEDD